MAKRTLFIYRGKRGTCSAMTVHRKLHGRRAVRTSTDEFGRVFHKTYEYLGTPHCDLIPGAVLVAAKNEKTVTDFFEKHKVPYIRIRPREVKISNWSVPAGGACSRRKRGRFGTVVEYAQPHVRAMREKHSKNTF